jgi:putative ABC transport system permease protein
LRFRLGLRSVLAHRLRFALCTVAVLLGVAFVAGSLIFTDTLSTALRRTFAGTTADIVVTPVPALDRGGDTLGTTSSRPVTLSADLANRIAAVAGVAGADPHLVIGGVEVLARDGRPIETYGVPTFGTGWPHDERTAAFRLLEGREPWGQGEVALDRATAGRAGYEPGDTIQVVTPTRTVTATLTGLISPGAAGISAGAPLVAFDSATAQLVLLGEPGWTSIEVAIRPGHDPGAVRAAIQQVAGHDVAVRTAAQVSADGENALDDTFGGFSAVLMMFAALALFVGAFLIVNTFSMLIAQRSRELAMLRAIGASRGQVTGSVLAEAVAIGTTGATLGLLLGAGVAAILQFVVGRLDLAVPSSGLQFHPRTIIVSYLVGIGVTLAAAYPAARRAGRLPPVAAMRDQVALPERSLRVRLALGLFALLMAASCYAVARQAHGLPGAILLGFGAAMALLGVMLTSPLVSRYAVGVLTLPFGRRAPVVLGRQNAQRNPRRTTATASALMISLALISGLVVVTSSAKASIDKGIADAIGTSDLVVSTDSARPFSSEVARRVADVPEVASVGRVRSMGGQVGKTSVTVDGVDPGVLEGPVVTRVEAGSVAGLRSGQAVLPRNLAKTLNVSVGSGVGLTTVSGTHHVTVAAVIAPNRQLDAVLLSLPRFEELGGASTDSTLYVAVTDGSSVDQVRLAVLDRLHDYPSVQVRDQQAYAKPERGPVEVVQSVVMLLALAILIAVLGIVNTLALGVVERTREIGLLRAIGMDRAQLRRMLQVESIAIALLGALSGVAIGVLFGSAVQAVMTEDGLAVRDIPVLHLLVAVLVSAGVGVLAALWPARRAARLDVLRAIASE